ncbi:hypothetical protein PVAND_006612 [Polypedilum vanderplanki]|uniref:RING-type domain-containing protein n=1 Tax=Polypedilum vanderplanki TaxID=319348 RepID=A0A9J6C3R2_POLVA|nr:hypothetical protein PVAND_006612 [Polypedilum vanderplanki]
MNISCVICSDLFVSTDSIYTTPCGHIFHQVCLIQWLERKKDCPQCRHKCTERNIFRIYFNNNNLDTSSVNSENLIETIDNLTLKVRESEMTVKNLENQKNKLEDQLQSKEKKIKKLDTTVSQFNQIIATMRHENDLLSSHRASYKIIETENAELKSKLELLQTVESVLTASQSEIDEILKQNLDPRNLAVMVGTLRRELNCNEERKNIMRKQLQSIKNDLRAEQEERKKLEEALSSYESKNHSLQNRLKKLEMKNWHENSEIEKDNVNVTTELNTPEVVKKPRLALLDIDDSNTPSPLSRDELQKRIQKIQESDSPYFKVKSSSIGLTCAIKNPSHSHEQKSETIAPNEKETSKLSIFRKPHLKMTLNTIKKPDNACIYNGLGSTTKVLQSDLKEASKGLDSFWSVASKPKSNFKKKLSAAALNK